MNQIDDAINEKFIMLIKQFKKENPLKDIQDLPLESINIYRIDKKNFQSSGNLLEYSEEED